jgi:YD repeat-containing protein
MLTKFHSNYNNLTLEGTLTVSAWNGVKNGILALKVRGELSGDGVLTVKGLGYRGGARGQNNTGFNLYGSQGESTKGLGAPSVNANNGGGGADQVSQGEGAGGGYGTNGGATGNAQGGHSYGNAQIDKLFMGSGGGGSGSAYNHSGSVGVVGGAGGGAVLLYTNEIDFSGSFIASGNNGSATGNSRSGGGAGGSLRINGNALNITSLGAVGGLGGTGDGPDAGDGGMGRIAVYYQTAFAYSGSNPSPWTSSPGAGAATPTPTSAPTPTTEPGWNSNQYHYEGAQAHAVTSVDRPLGTDSFTYDANGNMIERIEAGVTWTQGFNAENRLSSITDGESTWTFVYDGDGNRVKQINPDGSVTLFLGGGIYTIEDATDTAVVTKYYSIAGQRLAMANSQGLHYLLTDHLGSVSAVLDDAGALLSQQRYLPFGGERPIEGGIYETDFGYTGQRDLKHTATTKKRTWRVRFLSTKLPACCKSAAIGVDSIEFVDIFSDECVHHH